jgi:DNA-binding transcriptional ArsR family regulator
MKRVTPDAYPENNLADYKAAIFARHGIDVDAPGGMKKLAKLENEAMASGLLRAFIAPVNVQDVLNALQQGEATTDDMARRLGVHKTTASKHLLRLVRAGLVKADRVMRVRIYSLNEGAAK